jgi:hypothetical protein
VPVVRLLAQPDPNRQPAAGAAADRKDLQPQNCAATHRTYRALAECIFRVQRPWWVSGSGEYATLSYCRGLTVALHKTIGEARAAPAPFNSDACGGACHNAHQLVRFVKPSLARPRKNGA